MREINTSELKSMLNGLIKIRKNEISKNGKIFNYPLFIWGDTGIGKSYIISDICVKNDIDFIDIRGSQLTPTDLTGIPVYDPIEKIGKFIKIKSLLPDSNSDKIGIILLDEFPQTDELTQSSFYQLINDRKLGDYNLPRGYIIISSGNREKDGGVFFELPKPLKNRFSHVNLKVDIDSFINFIISKYGNNNNKTTKNLISYLIYQKNNDIKKIYNSDSMSEIFPTFRSWEKVLKMSLYNILNIYDILSDNVGKEISIDFSMFVELIKEIPNPKTLINDKIYFDDIQKQIISCMSVSNYILSDEKDKINNWTSFQYFLDLYEPKNPKNKRQELTILFLLNLKNNFDVLEDINIFFKKDIKYKKYKNIYVFLKNKFDILNDINEGV